VVTTTIWSTAIHALSRSFYIKFQKKKKNFSRLSCVSRTFKAVWPPWHYLWRCSVLFWRQCDKLCTSGFMDDVTFSCNGAIMSESKTTRMFSPVRHATAPGAKSAAWDCILLFQQTESRCVNSMQYDHSWWQSVRMSCAVCDSDGQMPHNCTRNCIWNGWNYLDGHRKSCCSTAHIASCWQWPHWNFTRSLE